MNTQLGWSTVAHIRNRARAALEYEEEVQIERGVFSGLAAFVAIWTFMLAALMAASISDNIKPAETDIDIAKIEPPVPSFTPVPEAPAPVYSVPAIDASVPPVWTPPADPVTETRDTVAQDQVIIERNAQTRMPTKITIIGKSERGQPANVIAAEPANQIEQIRVVPSPRTDPVPTVPRQDAASRVIDDIF